MTSTLEDSDADLQRRRELKAARVKRERANRIGTNLKPHIKEIVEGEAAAMHISSRTFLRILVCEALEARGHNLVHALKEWKERNPNETEDDDE